jgi:hypothetical protein
MRSVRVPIDERARKDDLERTRARKKKSDWLVNADPRSIGDPIRIEGPSMEPFRSHQIGLSDCRRAYLGSV